MAEDTICSWPYISSHHLSAFSHFLDLSWPYISSQFLDIAMTIYKISVIYEVAMFRYVVEEYLLRKLRCSGWEVLGLVRNVEDATFFSFVGRGLYVKALLSGRLEKLWAVFCQILYMDLGHSGWSIHISYCTCIGIQYKVFSYMGIQYLAMLKGIFKKLSRSATWEFSTWYVEVYLLGFRVKNLLRYNFYLRN